MTTDPADRLTRAAAKLRESDDPFRRAVADWLDETAATHRRDDGVPWCVVCGAADGRWPCTSYECAQEVADGVLGESFQQAARDLADIKQDGEPGEGEPFQPMVIGFWVPTDDRS